MIKKLFIFLLLFVFILSSAQAMIFLGEFKTGDTVKYRVNFHNDTGTIENPTSPEAQLEKPDNSFTALTAPAQINSKTGHYGGSIDTTGFTSGQYLIRVAGTVATAKTTATELGFSIVTNIASDVMGEMTSPSYGLSKINTDMAKASTALTNATWTDTKAGYIDASISSRSTYSGGAVSSVTAPITVGTNNDKTGYSGTCTNMVTEPPSASTIRTEMDSNSTKLAHLNADITSRLGTADYTAPDNANISAIKAKTDNLPADPASNTQVNTRLASADYTAPPTAASIWAYSQRILTSALTDETPARDMAGNAVTFPVINASVVPGYAVQNKPVEVKRGDWIDCLSFNLHGNYTGWTPRFAAKAVISATAPYVIAVKNATWTNAALGTGCIELTSTDIQTAGQLYGELELVKAGKPLTGINFIIKISEDVIK